MEHRPGPNDWHTTFADDDVDQKKPILEQGLGADEPDEDAIVRRNTASVKQLEKIKAEVQEAAKSLDAREAAINAREREIEAWEQARAIDRQNELRAAGEPITEENL